MFDTVRVAADTFAQLQVMSVQRKDEFVEQRQPGQEAKQKTTKEGVPLWKVTLSALNWRGRADTLTVTVPSTVNPMDALEPMQAVSLPGLMFGAMRKRDGSGHTLWWSAEGIEPAEGAAAVPAAAAKTATA